MSEGKESYLLAVLVRYYVSLRRSRISSQYDTILEQATDDSSARARCFGEWDALLLQKGIPAWGLALFDFLIKNTNRI